MKKFWQITFPKNCGNVKLWFAGRGGIWFQFAIWNHFVFQLYSVGRGLHGYGTDKICFSKYNKTTKKYVGTAWQW